MKTIIFSDLHGNLPALECLMKLYPKDNKWISLGDNVNYGPWSNECVQILKNELNCICVRGNHEKYFLNGMYDGKNSIVRSFFEISYPSFNQFDILKEYQDVIQYDKFVLTHTINDKYIFPDTKIVIKNNYILGHSHVQFQRLISNYILINPGSLGQNRKKINRGEYLLFDHIKKTYQLKFLEFDLNLLITEMKKKKYPKECIEYYLRKKND